MRCKNCGHEVDLHDLDDGFCSGVIYEQCDPNKPTTPTIPMRSSGSPTIPMRCDCPLYESEVEIAPFEQRSYLKARRIQIIESLMEMESHSLEERGHRTSKRMRKLEQVLSRLHRGSSGDAPEGHDDDCAELDKD